MDGALDELLRHPALWRAGDRVHDAAAARHAVATGFAALDQCLPGGGWPLGALTEILHPACGIGELSLVLPALATLSRGGHWLAWIAPPFHIAVPALEARGVDPARLLVVRDCAGDKASWAAEQALRSGACMAVLSWPARRSSGAGGKARDHTFRHLRRLQLAAEQGGALGFVFRGVEAAAQPSPAALRVRLQAREDGVDVVILKSRGGAAGRILRAAVQAMKHDAAAVLRGVVPASAAHRHTAAAGETPQPAPDAGTRLWLALEFPALALESLDPLAARVGPQAVSAQQGRQAPLLAVNAAARAAGVHDGMGAAAALTLCPALAVARHDPVLEAAALEGLAAWAGRYTSQVSLEPPRGLLLEIGASLGLFGGLGPLLERVRADLLALGCRVRRAVAPTPAGAWLLARSGDASPVTLGAHLAGRLSQVPVERMDLPARTLADLHALGLYTLGDCARLPRDGAGRRLGPELLALLDRALGRRPDPRRRWQPPARFERRVDLPVEGADRGLLLRAAQRLLHELCGFLIRHDRGAGALELHFAHRPGPATRCVLELVAPSRDPQHLLTLVRERLEGLPLERDVIYLGLRVERLLALPPRSGDLYAPRQHPQGRHPESVDPAVTEQAELLVERLGARLGREAVRGLVRVADHRPERISLEPAWHQCAMRKVAAAAYGGTDPRMPVWLLPEPQPLRGCDPLRGDGGWRIEQGPRRIESGWWDGHDVARDYYVARTTGGTRHWIYRERRPPGRWFVHGIFS